jgi:hypothetical protein
VHRDVLSGCHPAQVPADEVRPRVVQRDGRAAGVPDDVVAEVEVVDGIQPALTTSMNIKVSWSGKWM